MIIRVKDLEPEDLAALVKEGWLSEVDIENPESILAQFNI